MVGKLVNLKYFRGNGGFSKGFLIKQDGSPYDLTGLTVIWWFKKDDGMTRSITWTGIQTPTNRAVFLVPQNWFNEVTTYECQLEVYDASGILVWHNETKLIVKIEEPAGVHSD